MLGSIEQSLLHPDLITVPLIVVASVALVSICILLSRAVRRIGRGLRGILMSRSRKVYCPWPPKPCGQTTCRYHQQGLRFNRCVNQIPRGYVITYRAIAKMLGINHSRVQQIEQATLKKIRGRKDKDATDLRAFYG